MRLFPKVDGTVDRFDRAGLLSCPFSIAFTTGAVAAASGYQYLFLRKTASQKYLVIRYSA